VRIFLVGPKAIETAFRDASKGRADAVLVLPKVVVVSQRKEIADLTGKEPDRGDIPQARIYGVLIEQAMKFETVDQS